MAMVELDQMKFELQSYENTLHEVKDSLDLEGKKKRIEELVLKHPDVLRKHLAGSWSKQIEMVAYLKEAGMLDAKGKVQDALRTALKDKTLNLPEAFAGQKAEISELLIFDESATYVAG